MRVNIAIVPLSPFESYIVSNISIQYTLNPGNKLRTCVFKRIIEKESNSYLFLWLDLAALSAKVLVIVFLHIIYRADILWALLRIFTQMLFAFHWTLLEPPYERGFLPCPFSCPRGPLHWQWCHFSPGGTSPSDLWSGKTDELLLPPCFFARSILHVGVRFMNDGDLLKPSIQLPKDTALAPIAPTRPE